VAGLLGAALGGEGGVDALLLGGGDLERAADLGVAEGAVGDEIADLAIFALGGEEVAGDGAGGGALDLVDDLLAVFLLPGVGAGPEHGGGDGGEGDQTGGEGDDDDGGGGPAAAARRAVIGWGGRRGVDGIGDGHGDGWRFDGLGRQRLRGQ
jgi:hypothetical protein